MRLLLVRHALCDGTGHRLAGRAPGLALNDEGREQAQRLAAMIAAEQLDVCRTSPMERTVETARALTEPHGIEPVISHAFTEIDFGEWTGRSVADLEGDAVWRDFNSMRGTTRIPGGELMLEVQLRSLAGLHELQRSFDGCTVAIVSHADVIRALLAHLLGMPLDCMLRLEVAPASVSEVHLHGSWPQVVAVNRTAAGQSPRRRAG